jgi:hypothetical protein
LTSGRATPSPDDGRTSLEQFVLGGALKTSRRSGAFQAAHIVSLAR